MEYKKINELTTVVTGGTPSTRKNEYWDNGDIPWLQSGCCQNCDVDSTEKYITKEGYNNSSTHMMSADTVMIALTGATAGKVGYLKFEACGNQSITGILPCESLNQRYLFFYLLSQREKILADCVGGAQAHISQSYVKNMTIPILAIKEQEQIVGELTKVSNIVSLRQEEIQQLDNLVKARFVEMFGDPVSNSYGFPEATLPELGELGRGVSKHRPRNDSKLLGGDYPLIQTGDVANAGLYITSYGGTYSELGLKQSKMWNKGTLCITIAANIAKTAILEFDACFPDSVVGFIANEKTNNIFIHYWFSFFQAILESQAPESAQKNINLKILSELKVIVPKKEKQDEFVEFIEQVYKSKFDTMTFAPIYAIINLYLHTYFYQGRR